MEVPPCWYIVITMSTYSALLNVPYMPGVTVASVLLVSALFLQLKDNLDQIESDFVENSFIILIMVFIKNLEVYKSSMSYSL